MKFFIIVLFFTPLLTFSQKWEIDTISYEGDTYLLYPRPERLGEFIGVDIWMCDSNLYCGGLPADGAWIQFYEDSNQPSKIWHYENDQRHGKWTTYYLNGKLREEGNYERGKKDAAWNKYFENGQVYSQNQYDRGKKAGPWFVYTSSGTLQKSGIKDSLHREYYENGQKKLQYCFNAMGQVNYEWFENGQLKFIKTFIGGRIKDTIQTTYYSNGQLKSQGESINGANTGQWTYFYKNGQVKARGNFAQFKTIQTQFIPIETFRSYEVGKWEYFYENGVLMASGTYLPDPLIKENMGIIQEMPFPVRDEDWLYYDQNGSSTSPENIEKELGQILDSAN